MLISIIVFVVIFSLVVLGHELGHFYAAKLNGVRVEEFGIGMPPRIWGFSKGDTIYSVNWIPFGGFVRIFGEGGDHAQNKKSFIHKSPWRRLTILAGGILMNFAIGWVILMIGFWNSMPPLVSPAQNYAPQAQIKSDVVVINVLEKSAAQIAGLKTGDLITEVNKIAVKNPDNFKNLLQGTAGKKIELTVNRNGENMQVSIIPATEQSTGRAVVGAMIDQAIHNVKYVWWKVPFIALVETVKLVGVVAVSIVTFIYNAVTTASLPKDLAGPVGIASLTATMMQLGWLRVLQFVVFLSINLGVINAVPFPGLDGGRILFVVIEMLRGGKKVSAQVEGMAHTVGFMLLMLLILVVTYRDIIKLI